MGKVLCRHILVVLLLLGHAASLHAQAGGSGPGLVGSPPPPPEPSEWRTLSAPAIEKIGAGLYRIGEVTIDKGSRSISFPATVNMDKGLLEYLLVRVGGKTHESLFRTSVEPFHIQLALLLIGAEGSDRPLGFQGDPNQPRGDKMDISVKLVATGTDATPFRPEEWLAQRKLHDDPLVPAGKLDWTYTGSMVVGGQFVAQMEGSVMAIYHDPAALINNASPGGESDKIWFVREGSVPKVGTPVTLTIKPMK